MAAENNTAGQAPRDYYYFRCERCGKKIHILASACHSCGGKPRNMIYVSSDPANAVYGAKMNSAERCMKCHMARAGAFCTPVICFGTKKGSSCAHCRESERPRFECCQAAQKGDSA